MKSVVQHLLIGLVCAGTGLLMSCRQGSAVDPSGPPETGTPEFLRVPGNPALRKVLFIVDSVTVDRGGRLLVKDEDFDSVTSKRNFRMKIEIAFKPHSVSNDFLASVSTDAQYLMSSLDLQFGPHGTFFLKPADLKVWVKGMDLSGFSPKDRIYLYYIDNGRWVRMEGNVSFNVKTGELSCANGRLPHFSRYAFGR
jgi:hypothetical protein